MILEDKLTSELFGILKATKNNSSKITMGPTLLLFTWLSKEKELIANSNKEPQFYCNNKGAYTTSIHVYIIVFF